MEKVYIVMEEQTEGGWGYADFTPEAYTSHQAASDRAKELNSKKPPYCGYFFTWIAATMIK